MARTASFVKGLASTTGQKILIKIIGLIVTPIVLTYLDKTEYGVWVIIASVLGYMGLMDFGITGATSALTAKSNTKEDEHHINTIINNAFVLQSFIGFLIICIGLIFASYFPNIFNMGDYSKDDAWLVFVMAIIGYGMNFPTKSLKGLIQARQMIALSVWLEFFLFILTTSLNLYLLHLEFGLLALPLGTVAIRLLSFPLFAYFAKKSYSQLKFDFSLVTMTNMKEIFGVSSYWFVGMIAAMVIYSTDTILIGIYMSTAMVTMYALTLRLSEVIREFIYSINFTLMPAIGQIMGQGDVKKAQKIYLQSQPVILSLAVVGSVFIYLFNSYFVSAWVGDKYFAGDTLSLLFAGILFISVVFHASSLVIGADLKLKGITIVRISEAILNILLSIWLIQSYGLVGVALATLISGIITSFLIVPYMTIKHLKLSFIVWFKAIFVKVLIVFIMSIFWAFLAQKIVIYGIVGVVLALVIFILLSIISVWFIAMDQEIKGMIYAKIKK